MLKPVKILDRFRDEKSQVEVQRNFKTKRITIIKESTNPAHGFIISVTPSELEQFAKSIVEINEFIKSEEEVVGPIPRERKLHKVTVSEINKA